MTEKEYTVRLESLVKWIKNRAIRLNVGVLSQQEFGRRYMYYKERLACLKEEYSKSKEKEVREYFGY